jgi:UDP-N-acetylmuramoylalanine--D-glutamate ligase
LLNLQPDHMDRYPAFDDYAKAKTRIFMNQTAEDVAVVSIEALPTVWRLAGPLKGRLITFSAHNRQADLWLDWVDGDAIWCGLPECRGIILRLSETNLRGAHNAENIMATLAAGLALGLSVREMREAIIGYCPQPHRCEVVAKIGGVTYINDSKATNVDAVNHALRALPGRVILIAGGRDKALDYSTIKEVITEKVKLAVLIGEVQDRLCSVWGGAAPCVRAGSMAEAVRLAASHARCGDTVLLSPACASFDMFENYEHRGEEFKRVVFELL